MQGQAVQPTGIGQVLIPIVVVAVVFALRARRMTRSRPLKLGELWIVPGLYLLICAGALVGRPPTVTGWAALASGLILGIPLGWWRGKATHIDVHPETQTLQQRTSPIGMLILLGLVVAKSAVRTQAHGLDWLTDGLLGLALGTLTAMRVEMYLRAQRVLVEARARVFS